VWRAQALLYYKGFHAVQAHRISHALWARGQTILAMALQSRMSEVFAVDIHPGARIGYVSRRTPPPLLLLTTPPEMDTQGSSARVSP
jgi:hypothetical protein